MKVSVNFVVQYIVATSDHNLGSIDSCSKFCCVSYELVDDVLDSTTVFNSIVTVSLPSLPSLSIPSTSDILNTL